MTKHFKNNIVPRIGQINSVNLMNEFMSRFKNQRDYILRGKKLIAGII